MTRRMINVPVGTPEMRAHRSVRWPVITNRRSVDPDGASVTALIDQLTKIQDELGQSYTKLSVKSEQDCGCYHECRCSPSYYVWGTRAESDLEYNYRIQEEQRIKDEQDARDRKAYEELKKKFGDNT